MLVFIEVLEEGYLWFYIGQEYFSVKVLIIIRYKVL